MTDDRIFKNKVKEVAELNGLSYTDAKKAVIELNNRIECILKKEPLMYSDLFYSGASAKTDLTNVVIRKPQGKFIQIGEIDGISQYVELSLLDKTYSIDFSPLNNGVKNGHSNVTVAQAIDCEYDTLSARLIYSLLAEDFNKENIYFVDSDNYFYQMPKLIKSLKQQDEEKEILLGIIGPIADDPKYVDEIQELMKNKTIYAVLSDFPVPEEKSVKCTGFSSRINDFVNINNYVKYYPFDKLHGGSYHRSTSKIVVGHKSGTTSFTDTPVSLIEKSDTSCIERIYQLNKDNSDFIHWKTKADVKDENLSNNSFIKIDFEMDSEDLETLLLMTRDLWHYFDSGKKNSRKMEIIIETPDAEKIESYYHDKSFEYDRFITRYVMIDDNLYDRYGTQISLYKV